MSSELGQVHEKINKVDKDLTYLIGKFDGILPSLATKEDLSTAIAKHHTECNKKSILKPKTKTDVAKLTALIVGALGGLTAAVYELVKILG